ncbi:MAG: carboxymuconolactone decarboxylase family protein [Chloroflexi bacterium]|nr:carboxymuconolactone decarboxylase family protein [Chloroflexota bacterium]
MKLDNRTGELIAVGASVAAGCQPCLKYHAGKALESGAEGQEIADAIEIGRMVRKGASANMDKFISGLTQNVPSEAAETDSGCGCNPAK